MLRITVHDFPGAVTLRLEGRMAVPWLHPLEECWRQTLAVRPRSVLSVDLTGVTSIDSAGKCLLAVMARQGAIFMAGDCLTRSIVDEVMRAAVPNQTRPRSHR